MSTKNKVLGDYRIEEILGRGTFSKVMLGTHMTTNEKVAIKILEKSKIIDKDDFERVKREIQIIKEINHLNVIKVLQVYNI